jgi:hypothetical protein
MYIERIHPSRATRLHGSPSTAELHAGVLPGATTASATAEANATANVSARQRCRCGGALMGHQRTMQLAVGNMQAHIWTAHHHLARRHHAYLSWSPVPKSRQQLYQGVVGVLN